jgi:hypothetical protein
MNDLHEALEALVPANGDSGDWDDILRRAGIHRARALAPRKPVRRGVVIALAIVALVVVPALIAAVLTRTNVLFSSSQPAPNMVKKQFLDLAFGAPPRFAIEPLAAEAREVGTFRFGGRTHKLWVAPTRRGGFCYVFEHAAGGCVPAAADRRPLGVSLLQGEIGETIEAAASRIEGTVGHGVERLEIRYADGSLSDAPLTYVSDPIDAGFFALDIPAEHRAKATRATAVVALDRDGNEVARYDFRYGPPLRARPPQAVTRPAVPRRLRAKVAPSEPAQRGAGDGFSVLARANGAVTFDANALSASQARLLGRAAGFGCFKLVREFGIFDVKGVSFPGRFARHASIRIWGMSHPWDGCEIQGGYGHVWPDRNGSHSAVEIPLTEKGRRFFADRAAARDLSLFVRSARLHEIRRATGAALVQRLARYPLVRLTSATGTPRVGKIGYARTADGVTFVERSSTGRRFFIEIRHGKIRRSNVRPYALAF